MGQFSLKRTLIIIVIVCIGLFLKDYNRLPEEKIPQYAEKCAAYAKKIAKKECTDLKDSPGLEAQCEIGVYSVCLDFKGDLEKTRKALNESE